MQLAHAGRAIDSRPLCPAAHTLDSITSRTARATRQPATDLAASYNRYDDEDEPLDSVDLQLPTETENF